LSSNTWKIFASSTILRDPRHVDAIISTSTDDSGKGKHSNLNLHYLIRFSCLHYMYARAGMLTEWCWAITCLSFILYILIIFILIFKSCHFSPLILSHCHMIWPCMI
jgi:hypothetical protein